MFLNIETYLEKYIHFPPFRVNWLKTLEELTRDVHWVPLTSSNLIHNKNAFQQDAYRLLVARISRHALLLGGVPAWGVYLPGGCTCPGVYLPQGCTCPGGVPAWVVYLPGGALAQGGTM